MNTLPTNGFPSASGGRDSHDSGEDTLRLIASLPAPEGLAERVKAGMQSAPESGRVLAWRGANRPAGGWMYTSVARGAAAAAIVCAVAGGGWRIYSRVQPGPTGNVLMMPAPATPSGSRFGNAGATRVPDTLDRPVLIHPVPPSPELNVQKAPLQPKTVRGGKTAGKKKTSSRPAAAPVE
jgi:hypothetical protein